MSFAHLGPIMPSQLWSSWNIEPSMAAALAFGVALYRTGERRLPGRRHRAGHAIAAYAGFTVLSLAIMSPVDALSETLFSAHMVQHLLLILVVPPLLLVGRVARTVTMGLPTESRRSLNRILRRSHRLRSATVHPVVAVSAHAIVLWTWHAPGPYEAALRADWLHVLEHATFVVSALAVWRVAFDRAADLGVRIAVVFATALQSGLLAAALLFAGRPLYPTLAEGTTWWGLTPLADQQLAGATMWVPMGLVYLIVVLAITFRGFRRMEAMRHV